MKAYKGIVEDGVIVLVEGAQLPEGTIVTVTVGEAELLRARISNAIRGKRKVKVRMKPVTPGLVMNTSSNED